MCNEKAEIMILQNLRNHCENLENFKKQPCWANESK